jgi:hypothetical protein
MVSPTAIILFGVGLMVISRLGRSSEQQHPTGMWNDPPTWARLLFGARRNRVQLDDALISVVASLWLIGGTGLAVTG